MRRMQTLNLLVVSLVVVLLGSPASRAADGKKESLTPAAECPTEVRDAVAKRFPDCTIDKCQTHHEHGKDLVDVKLTRKGGSRLEVDLTPVGQILQTEERIGIDKVPAEVIASFAAKYPKAKTTGAEKQSAEETTSYEIGFTIDGAKREATFTEGGRFVEEE